MFINIPENYSSLRGELIYDYSISEPEDIVIEVKDSDSGELLGVKKFYSTTSASINVAPIILADIDSREVVTQANFSTGVGYLRSVTLSVGETSSEERTFTISEQEESLLQFVTTMPKARILGAGECDNLLVLSPKYETLAISIALTPIDDQGEVVSWPFATYGNSLDKVFTVCADNFNSNYQAAVVTLKSNNETFDEIYYLFSDSDENQGGYRIAWLSKRGSIEFYTLPLVSEVLHKSDGSIERQLRSAYGTREEMEALMGILSSERVWGVVDDEFAEIEVITTESTLLEAGALQLLNLRIKENG